MPRTKADEPHPDDVTPGGRSQEDVADRPAVPGTVRPEDYPLEEREEGDVSR